MNEIIVTTPEQLQTTIEAAVVKALEAYNKKPTVSNGIENDNLTIEEAAAFLSDNGCKISVQTIYTKKGQGEIPYRKIGARLIFSKKALLSWLEQQTTTSVGVRAESASDLAKSAKNQG
ncbi:helix-turn-helix domain-containing protein [uncultured Alistipes sp.]|uniref:helix-turn-helix domain-containing protein n=1 Tax=uncultured Alistipes sp. TaxID=538949 RepID=UPI00266BDFC2|nr:helix-turn-helix domain-containing protein [uncultured Alistipes sp.]